MSFRGFLERLEKDGKTKKVGEGISKKLEIAGLMHGLKEQPLKFENVKESEFPVAGNIFSTRELIAEYFGLRKEALLKKMVKAIDSPTKPEEVGKGACQEVVEEGVDLNRLPILFHCEKDGGNYVSSGVMIAGDEEMGQNMSFHRCMQLDKKRFSVRILPRHLHEFIERNGGELDVALSVGNGANVLLAAATSVELGEDETHIANSLEELEVVKAKSSSVLVPADSEFVLEGRILKEEEKEGPFVDLTETYDIVRKQPVFEVKKVTHRKNAIWHALLPGMMEHKLLMGLPKEPTIYREVNKVCTCRNAGISLGGCSWLHGVVQIKKEKEEDGKKAIEAAFKGHKSMKHVWIVDEDIDLFDEREVEWAFATRFQGDKDLALRKGEKGSSLDPSADFESRKTTKLGFDCTMPLNRKDKMVKAGFPEMDSKKFLAEGSNE